jgi:hypothetical protein
MSLTAAFAAFSGGACSPYSPDLGDEPYKCADTEPFCPSGYSCNDQGSAGKFCINSGGTSGVDAGSGSGLDCTGDVTTEGPNRNDDISHAFATPVESSRGDISFAGLVICPAGDRDTYSVTLLTMGSIDATVTTDGGAPVQVNLLNSGGTSINNGTSNGAMSIHAFAANLPPATYYVQAFATATATNHYKLAIKATHP